MIKKFYLIVQSQTTTPTILTNSKISINAECENAVRLSGVRLPTYFAYYFSLFIFCFNQDLITSKRNLLSSKFSIKN